MDGRWSKEWFEGLGNRIKFPVKMAFYYDKDHDCIKVVIVDSKATKTGNVRYESIKSSPLYFHSKNTAILTLEEVKSPGQYFQILTSLQKEWVTDEY